MVYVPLMWLAVRAGPLGSDSSGGQHDNGCFKVLGCDNYLVKAWLAAWLIKSYGTLLLFGEKTESGQESGGKNGKETSIEDSRSSP
jgi:hypothetical protein